MLCFQNGVQRTGVVIHYSLDGRELLRICNGIRLLSDDLDLSVCNGTRVVAYSHDHIIGVFATTEQGTAVTPLTSKLFE